MDARRVPTPLCQPAGHMLEIGGWRQWNGPLVATFVAKAAGRHDVVGAISATVTACMQMLRRALEQARPAQLGQWIAAALPHLHATVVATVMLAFKSGATKGFEASHGNSRTEDWVQWKVPVSPSGRVSGAGATAFCGGQTRSRPEQASRPAALSSYQSPGRSVNPVTAEPIHAHGSADPTAHLTGIGVPRSTGTAVTAFCGEPSISRSE